MTPAHDLIIVGAGFAGMYSTIHAVRAGLDILGLEAAADVGGTWYWNRYPGARCDVESIDYSFSFDDDLQREWRWSERYATQPEILRYLNHVADRFDVRPHYRFGERLSAASWNERAQCWEVRTESGMETSARWLIMATGGLSQPQLPDIPAATTSRVSCCRPRRGPRSRSICAAGTWRSSARARPACRPSR